MNTRQKQFKSVVNDEAPASVPQTTPPNYGFGSSDHSFTLQAIMELQKSVGEMNATLNTLKTSVDGVKTKVEDLVSWKHRILGAVFAIGVLFSGLLWLISKYGDYISIKAPASVSSQVTPQAPIQPPQIQEQKKQ